MKKYSQFQQITSLSLIFLLLLANNSCVGFRVISSSNLPMAGYSSYNIKAAGSSYLISFPEVINGRLSGKLDSVGPMVRHSTINVYITSDSVIKIKSGNILSIPIESITKVEQPKLSVLGTFLVVGGVIFVFILILKGSSFGFNPFPNGLI